MKRSVVYSMQFPRMCQVFHLIPNAFMYWIYSFTKFGKNYGATPAFLMQLRCDMGCYAMFLKSGILYGLIFAKSYVLHFSMLKILS